VVNGLYYVYKTILSDITVQNQSSDKSDKTNSYIPDDVIACLGLIIGYKLRNACVILSRVLPLCLFGTEIILN